MVRPIVTRFVSFLDRFDERMQVDCEQLKRQLIAQVDAQFVTLRKKVAQLRSQFGGSGGRSVSTRSTQILELPDDPVVENVSLEQWIHERTVAAQQRQASGRKRKYHITSQSASNTKKRKSNRKFVCKFVGCDRLFDRDIELARHERIHLDIKPFACTWPDCGQSARKRSNLRRHIRNVHFGLLKTVKQQQQLNMADERDPNLYIRVDTDQLTM